MITAGGLLGYLAVAVLLLPEIAAVAYLIRQDEHVVELLAHLAAQRRAAAVVRPIPTTPPASLATIDPVASDEELLSQLACGQRPADAEQVARLLYTWRLHVLGGEHW